MECLLKVDDVAKILNISVSSVYKYAENGEINSIKIGTALRFSEKSIFEYVEICNRRNKGEDDHG